MIGVIFAMILLNSVTAYLYNSKLADFKTYFLELNDIINVFVPISYFHLQHSKFYACMDRAVIADKVLPLPPN